MSQPTSRLQKFLSGRGMQKLRRDKLAMTALSVIVVYLLVALCVGLGALSLDSVTERVGPENLRGFGANTDGDRRINQSEFMITTVEQAASSKADPEQTMADYDMAGLRIEQGTPEEVLARVSTAFEALDEAAEYLTFDTPEAEAALVEMERATDELFSFPTGSAGTKRKLALLLGTDRQGRSILFRAIYSTKVAVQIGIVAALISVLIGTLLGAAAGYFGGWVDHAVVWLYSTFSSIPWIVLLMVLASAFRGVEVNGVQLSETLIPVYAAFCMSFWISPCRVIRGEVMKIKELEYVQAASAMGFGGARILLRHVIPNTAHLMFINFSLLFIGAIKAEVILSFLGLGVKNQPSWGVMINYASPEVLNGFYWQIGTATVFMLVLVYAFNILSDALQDAFDPKHVS